MKILDKIEIYYKKNKKIIKKTLDEKKTYNIIFDQKNDELIHLQNNNNTVLIGEYSFYGIYQPDKHIWIWGTSIPGIKKKHNKKILKIKEMSYLFENSNNEIEQFYHQFLSRDMIKIPENNKDEIKYMDRISKLLIYLGNDIVSFTPKAFNGNYQMITMHRIKENFN